jgi:flagellum-specific peptidoglycan hydrolase FlgJ
MGKLSLGKVASNTDSVMLSTTEYVPVEEPDKAPVSLSKEPKSKLKAFSSMNSEERHEAIVNYIEVYKDLAIGEMKQYKIPASIKLAQGILESGAGTSTLTQRDNNHFGVKCRTKCDACLCRNYMTKEHRNGVTKPEYAFFMSYESAWWSYREHSKLLTGPTYKSCFTCKGDYKCFAKELKRSGYATDPNYASALINIINRYNLHQYDQADSFHS